MKKLEPQQKHILRLVARDRDSDGWAKVCEALYPHLSQAMPVELVEFEKLETGGRARLTDEGQNVVDAMEWL